MHDTPNISAIAHVIQQAVAPVFLLTGVGAVLGVLTNRLGRIIDRFRTLEQVPQDSRGKHGPEMAVLDDRRRWIHGAIIFCTVCALLVCIVIAALFVGFEFGVDPSRTVSYLFITAMLALITGLLCFLREIAIATKNFKSY